MSFRRGDIVDARLPDEPVGSEQTGTRPCIVLRHALVVQNDIGNKYASTTIVIPVSTVKPGATINPIFQVPIRRGEGGLHADSLADCGQVMTISMKRVNRTLGRITAETMTKIEHAVKRSLGLR